MVTAQRRLKKAVRPATRDIDLLAVSRDARGLFWREVFDLKALSSPNLRNIIDILPLNKIRLTLEPLFGMSLSEILRNKTLTKYQMANISNQVCTHYFN